MDRMSTSGLHEMDCIEETEEVVTQDFFTPQRKATMSIRDISDQPTYDYNPTNVNLGSSLAYKLGTSPNMLMAVGAGMKKMSEGERGTEDAINSFLSKPSLEINPSELLMSDFDESIFNDMSGGDLNASDIRGPCVNKSLSSSNVNHNISVSIVNQSINGPIIHHNITDSLVNQSDNSSSGNHNISGSSVSTSNSSSSSTRKEEVEFVPLPSDKEKNPPYLWDGKKITTDKDIPVKFVVRGAKAGMEVHVTRRYVDPLIKKTPVQPCKEHEPEEPNLKVPKEFSFYTTDNDCEYPLSPDGHPTAVVPVRDPLSYEDEGMFSFCVVFLCLNSCHRNKGKIIDLVMTLVDDSGRTLKEQRFKIRVCKNVKRDHKDVRCDNKDVKRNHKDLKQGISEEPTKKVLKREPDGSAMMVSSPKSFLPLSPQDTDVTGKMEYYWVGLPAKSVHVMLPLLQHMNADVRRVNTSLDHLPGIPSLPQWC